ncbi:hypothetical protein LOD99_3130 [Oopsacas minuta]|uniref:Uncharacterized protein n=1 Tax=Oopsacas minuta TaxID=111878 RepID=A0AAV7JYD7_9METZ|nr:hypothetical protein LOD99_3130 [Oopsacas minuta]
MAEASKVSESSKTRLDLAIILKVHDYDINQAADEVVRIINLEEDKRHSVYSLMSKVAFNFRKSKKSIESLMIDSGMFCGKNSHPNSCFSNQPVALICQKETIDTVIELSKLLNSEIVSLNEDGFDHLNGHVKVEVKASMFDGKTLVTMTDCSIEDIKETICQLTSDGKELMSYNTKQRIALSFVPNVYKDALTEIHRNLSALLRVANSNEVVDVERFRVLSQETYILILQTFPWVSISNTLHKFLAHAHQFIERNDRVGLCSLSEEGLEQGHKLIREFSTHLSRKSDFLSGLSDGTMRLYIYGCPILNEKFRRIIICSTCGQVGHQNNCVKNRQGENATNNIDNEDSLLQNSIDELFLHLTLIHQ